jgi:hypothetical protein
MTPNENLFLRSYEVRFRFELLKNRVTDILSTVNYVCIYKPLRTLPMPPRPTLNASEITVRSRVRARLGDLFRCVRFRCSERVFDVG